MDISATNPSHAGGQTDEVGPSRVMEIGLHALVFGLLGVSIIGIAYVYGFNLETGSLLDNTSAAVRAQGSTGGSSWAFTSRGGSGSARRSAGGMASDQAYLA